MPSDGEFEEDSDSVMWDLWKPENSDQDEDDNGDDDEEDDEEDGEEEEEEAELLDDGNVEASRLAARVGREKKKKVKKLKTKIRRDSAVDSRSREAALQEHSELNPYMLMGDEDDVRVVSVNKESDEAEPFEGRMAATKIYDDWDDHVYAERLAVADLRREEDESTIVANEGFRVPTSAWETLHQYQKEGVAWLMGLYRQGIGGILGDEMGLGKTAQLCVHLDALARRHASRVASSGGLRSKINTKERGNSAIFLIVCPATVLFHWLKELHRWVPSLRAVVIHSISKTGSELASLGEAGVEMALRRLQRSDITRGLVAITTYDGLRKYQKSLSLVEWTAVCLDEGQKIRNPTAKITSICKELPAFHRLILSGTPIQNNLTELWSLLDFCYPGRLGTLPAFEQEFAAPIRAGVTQVRESSKSILLCVSQQLYSVL